MAGMAAVRTRALWLAVAVVPASAWGVVRTWDGGGGANTNLTYQLNWDGDVTPAFDGSEDVYLQTAGTTGAWFSLPGRTLVNSLSIYGPLSMNVGGSGSLVLNSGNLFRSTYLGTQTNAWQFNPAVVLRNTGVWTNDLANYEITMQRRVTEENGSHGIIKRGRGNVSLLGGLSLTGDLLVQEGSLVVRPAAGYVPSIARGVADGGTLYYSYDLGGQNLVHDSAELRINAGKISMYGQQNTLVSETAGSLVFAGGSGGLELDVDNRPYSLSVGEIRREGRSIGWVAATVSGLGKDPSTTVDAGRVVSTGATPALVGGNGAAGSSTISIIPWLFSDVSHITTNLFIPDTFLTYDTRTDSQGKTIGLRPLDAFGSEMAKTITAGTDSDENVRLRIASSTVDSATAINALQMDRGSVSGAGTLKVKSGAVILTYGSSIKTAGLDFGAREGVIWNDSNPTTPSVISAAITGSGGLTIGGSGTTGILQLDGTNTYSGETVLANMQLRIHGDQNLGSGDLRIAGTSSDVTMMESVRIANVSTETSLSLSKRIYLDSALAISAPTLQLTGAMVLSGNRILDVGATTRGDVTGVISESAAGSSLTIHAGGNVHLSGASTYTGQTTIRSGSELYLEGDVLPGVAGPLGQTSRPVQLGDEAQWGTAKLYLSPGSRFGREITIPYFIARYNYPHRIGINAPGTATVSSMVSLDRNPLELWATGGATLNFEGSVRRLNDYTGTPMLRVGKYGTLAAGENADGTVVFHNQDGLDADVWTYNGTLRIDGATGMAGRGFYIGEGSRLGGSGLIRANVVVLADGSDTDSIGGILAPGSSTGTLQFTSLAIGNRSIYEWELGANLSSYDRIEIASAPDLQANLTLKLSSLNGLVPRGGQFTIMSWDAGAPAVLPTWTIDYGTTNWPEASVSYDAANRQFVLSVVPEPTSVLVLTAALSSLLATHRPRRGTVAHAALSEDK